MPPDRFFKKIDFLGSCWRWIAAKDRYGYGVWCPNGTRVARAHRTMYEFVHGPLENLALHHTCENRDCVNPTHLVALTHKEHKQITPRERQADGTYA